MNVLANWWHRRKALRELSVLLRFEEDAIKLDDRNPFNRASAALAAGSPEEAFRCWQTAAERYPHIVSRRPETLSVLCGTERYELAEQLMFDGHKRRPKDPFFLEALAEIAHRQHNFSEAAARWARVRRSFPNHPRAYSFGLAALIELRDFDEAERLASRMLSIFGQDTACRIEWARLAEAREDWESALERWRYIEVHLHHVSGIIGAARVLRQKGLLDDAIEKLSSAQLSFGRDPDFRQVFADFRNEKLQQEADKLAAHSCG